MARARDLGWQALPLLLAGSLVSFAACTGRAGGGPGPDDADASVPPVGVDAAPPVAVDAAPPPPPDATPGCQAAGDRPGVCSQRGVYDGPVEVELVSHIPDAPIFYTLDGSAPGPETGTRYTGPFMIEGHEQALGQDGAPDQPFSGVVILRTAVFADGVSPSTEAVHSYVFPHVVVAQPAQPLGYPAQWKDNPRGSDYEMDPAVLADSDSKAAAVAALRELPAVSVVMNTDDLWGPDRGIYMNPSLEGLEWERPASFEILYADGTSRQSHCGIRIQGGSSQLDWKVDKLSLRLVFRDIYGQGELVYPVFPDSSVFEFDTLVLDAHLNFTFVHPEHAQRIRSQYVRDLYIADLQRAAGGLAPHGRFVHLYLNGLYWGLYELHERPDEHFAAAHIGGQEESYDVFRHEDSQAVYGDTVAWDAMLEILRRPAGMADPQSYAEVQGYLDIAGFIDYMLVNFYAGNTDWPHHNWYAARERVPGAGFRFFSWDAEHVLKAVVDDLTGRSDQGTPGEIYQELRQNPDFRAALDARATELYGPGGIFYVNPARPAYDPARPEDNRPAHLYMQRAEEVRAAMLVESARWGDNRRPDQPYTVADWQAELDFLLDTYFPQRSSIARGQLPRP
jgi:hypothetical protein